MAEEEVMVEVEAVQAVYADDCRIIQPYPPHLQVRLRPRTADVSSQQFVEATIGIHAGPKYPEDPPDITITDSKGLDERRQKHLITSIQVKAFELASCFMLVALCEEAVERLSSMNHPDGDCPLCLYPLLDEEAGSNSMPFMKLMSCFHCFHCDCIVRWWNFIKTQNEKEITSSSSFRRTVQDQQDMRMIMEQDMGKCPVCRKVFLAKDIEHVLGLSGTVTPVDSGGTQIGEDILHSDLEKIRKHKFEAIMKLQQENNGLIEPKRDEVLLPGMFLPPPVTEPSTDSVNAPVANCDTNPGSSARRPGSRKSSHSNARKHRPQNSRKQVSHWIRKDSVSER